MGGFSITSTGSTGSTASTGSTGSTGSTADEGVGLGSPVLRPIGLSPTLGLYNGWWPAVRWPPSDLVSPPLVAFDASWPKFPELAWDPDLYAMVVLAEFVQQPGWAAIAPGPVPPPAAVEQELADLATLVEYRPELMPEALAQSTDIVGYWGGMLMFSSAARPWTFRLARIAIEVGLFMVMKLKYAFKRPRPSQLSPALMPPIAVPGHASYPSGHATQAYLLSALLGKVMPAAVTTPLDRNRLAPQTTLAGDRAGPESASLLDRLAERVARNREVLGLHYRSDSEAGKAIAGQILPLLLNCSSLAGPDGLIARAHAEWHQQTEMTGSGPDHAANPSQRGSSP